MAKLGRPRNRWTPEEDAELRRRAEAGETDVVIAEALEGRSPWGVREHRHVLGIPSKNARNRNKWTDAEIAVVKEGIAQGLRLRAIAEKLPERTVSQTREFAINRLNYTTRKVNHLTEEELNTLTTDFLAYMPRDEIARKLGRTVGVINQKVMHLGLKREKRRARLASRFAAAGCDPRPVDEIRADIQRQEQEAKAARNAEQAAKVDAALRQAVEAVGWGASRRPVFQRALLAGATLQEIGDAFDITRERVRQIVHGVTPGITLARLAERLASLNPRDYEIVTRAVKRKRFGEEPTNVESAVHGGLAPEQPSERRIPLQVRGGNPPDSS